MPLILHAAFPFITNEGLYGSYFNTVEVDPQVFKNMRIFKGNGKEEKDPIFDRVTVRLQLPR